MSSVGVLGAALAAWEYGLPPGPCAYARVMIRLRRKMNLGELYDAAPVLPHVWLGRSLRLLVASVLQAASTRGISQEPKAAPRGTSSAQSRERD